MAENEIKETAPKAKAVTDPWKKTVKIKLPRPASSKDSNFMLVAVNGKYFKVMRGKEIEVPQPVAEEIEKSFIMQDKRDDYIASLVR